MGRSHTHASRWMFLLGALLFVTSFVLEEPTKLYALVGSTVLLGANLIMRKPLPPKGKGSAPRSSRVGGEMNYTRRRRKKK